MVIGFTVLSQVTNVLFVRVWGAMADRTGSKTVLSLSASLYLLVIIGWVFTTNPDRYFLSLPLLAILHVFAGIAAAGVLLTIQTLTLKSAPPGRATPYLGIAGMAAGLGAGTGPVVGGALADFFSVRVFRIDFSWSSPNGLFELPAVTLTGFDFLFAIAFILGLFSLNLLAALREEGEIGRESALNELMAGSAPMVRAMSSVPGVGAVSAASYGYLRRVPGGRRSFGGYGVPARLVYAGGRRLCRTGKKPGPRGAGPCGERLGRDRRPDGRRGRAWTGTGPSRHSGSVARRKRSGRRGGKGSPRRCRGNAQDAGQAAGVPAGGRPRSRVRHSAGRPGSGTRPGPKWPRLWWKPPGRLRRSLG